MPSQIDSPNAGSSAVQNSPLEDAIDREDRIERAIHEQSVALENAQKGLPPSPAVERAIAESRTFASTSDKRTVNNVMRHEYRELSLGEKTAMQLIKDKGLELWDLFDTIGKTDLRNNTLPSEGSGSVGGPAGSRELSLAKTAIEEAVMWATKHITR